MKLGLCKTCRERTNIDGEGHKGFLCHVQGYIYETVEKCEDHREGTFRPSIYPFREGDGIIYSRNRCYTAS